MKPPKFHVGQAVVALPGSGEWDNPFDYREPQPDRIYKVLSLGHSDGLHFIELAEIPGCRWEERMFAPIEELPAEALAQLLKETLEPVTA